MRLLLQVVLIPVSPLGGLRLENGRGAFVNELNLGLLTCTQKVNLLIQVSGEGKRNNYCKAP